MPSAISAAQPEPLGGISQTSRPRWAKRMRLDPLAAMRREVLDVEPGGVRDGLGHRALVETWRALARRCAGACGRDREACRAARRAAAARAISPARARAASGAPRARPPRRRSRPGRSRGRARGRARACRSAAARSAQARTAPGVVHERGPNSSTTRSGMRIGERPEPLSPCSFPPCQTSENASPPTPLSVGSQTVRQAAAASAASIALPPCSSARTPARVAAGWLVATSAPPTIVGIRGKSLRAKRRTGEQAVEVDLHAGVSTVRSLIPVAARAVPRARAAPRARGARASRAARRRRRARGSP